MTQFLYYMSQLFFLYVPILFNFFQMFQFFVFLNVSILFDNFFKRLNFFECT